MRLTPQDIKTLTDVLDAVSDMTILLGGSRIIMWFNVGKMAINLLVTLYNKLYPIVAAAYVDMGKTPPRIPDVIAELTHKLSERG